MRDEVARAVYISTEKPASRDRSIVQVTTSVGCSPGQSGPKRVRACALLWMSACALCQQHTTNGTRETSPERPGMLQQCR